MDKKEQNKSENNKLRLAQKTFIEKYNKNKKFHSLISFCFGAGIISIAILLFFLFAVSVFKVNGNGMENSVPNNSYVIINKLAYVRKEPSRGDIINYNGKIKRVIGLPRETILFDDGTIYINGIPCEEEYLKEQYTFSNKTDFIIPNNCFFVLSDDRDCVEDSRTEKMIEKKDIKGKLLFII